MNENEKAQEKDIFSKVLRAGRRTYFFDVRETRAGDYYMTITESKKFVNEDGSFNYKKHKIYLYKEDFNEFKELFDEASNFIYSQKGSEVISEKHQSDWSSKQEEINDEEVYKNTENPTGNTSIDRFTDISFEDI